MCSPPYLLLVEGRVGPSYCCVPSWDTSPSHSPSPPSSRKRLLISAASSSSTTIPQESWDSGGIWEPERTSTTCSGSPAWVGVYETSPTLPLRGAGAFG